MKKTLFAIIIPILFGAPLAYAATILLTQSSDSLNTGRTNTNTSLTNLNAAFSNGTSTEPSMAKYYVATSTLIASQLPYASTTAITASGSICIGSTCYSSIPLGANPTVSVGLSAVNGSASTFLRSDAAPALDQTIVPTMTGLWAFANTGTTTFSGGISSGTKIAAPYFNATSSTATSTFNGGIKSPCFSNDGIACLGSGSGTVGSGTTGQFPYYAGAGTTLTATSSIFLSSAGALSLTTPLATGSGGLGTSTWVTNSIPFFNGTRFTESNSLLNFIPNDTAHGAVLTLGSGSSSDSTADGYIKFGAYNGPSNSQLTYLNALNTTASAITVTLPGVSGSIPVGSGSTNRVAYWSGSSALTSNANLTFNGTLLTAANASTTHLTAATSFQMPNSSNPSPLSAGYLTMSTNSPYQLHIGNGAGGTTIFDPRPAFVISISSTTPLTGTTTSSIFVFPYAMTLTNELCTVQPSGATAEAQLIYANPSAYTSVSTYQPASTTPGLYTITSNNTPAIQATSSLSVGAITGSATSVSCSFYGNPSAI